MPRVIGLGLFFIAVMGQSLLVGAAEPVSSKAMKQEIAHLMRFVGQSSCLFIRNGSEYSGEKALKHIQRKYSHFKDEIDSSEKFIELSASKSTMSNKPYTIRCESQQLTSQDWLLQELSRFRAQSSALSQNAS